MRTATPNDVYTQQGAKPARQEDINAKISHLILAQLPRTTLTHSKAPNPHARKTPLLMAQLPRTQFTHSKLPNPHGSDASTQNFRSSYWHSYPERRLHTATCQTRMATTHQHTIFAAPIGTATPNDVYTQQAAKPGARQRRISTKFSQHKHLRCKRQYNSGDTDLSHRYLLCKRQYNYGDTDMSHRHFLCKRQCNCGDKPAGAQRRHRAPADPSGGSGRCTCHTEPPRRRPF